MPTGTVAVVAETEMTPQPATDDGFADEVEFTARVERFLADHCSRISDPADDESEAHGLVRTRAFQRALVDAGLAGLTYPTQLGGAGLTPLHQEVFTRVSAGWRLPNGPLAISHGMCLPMLAQFGTEEQKARYLPDNISAETIWCQHTFFPWLIEPMQILDQLRHDTIQRLASCQL